jgi:methyl-accepting chemotaxis protein
MSDVTSWAPAEGADLVSNLNTEGSNVLDLGEQILHNMSQLTGDGLLGASGEGANQLAAGIHSTAQAVKDTTHQVASHVTNYGDNMTHLDAQYGNQIAGG